MTMTYRRRAIDCVLVVFGLLVVSLQPATAHSSAFYYYGTWNAGTGFVPVTVPWQLGNTPSLDAATVGLGPLRWNNVGQSMTFRYDGQRNVNSPREACSAILMDNWVFQRTLDGVGGTLAETWTCWRTTPLGARQMNSFKIEFDGGESWYNGTGDAPSTQIDVWSVSSHEFGHATGWVPYHLDDGGANPTLCMDDSTAHTMCAFYTPGTERMRTLETHDIDTFSAAY